MLYERSTVLRQRLLSQSQTKNMNSKNILNVDVWNEIFSSNSTDKFAFKNTGCEIVLDGLDVSIASIKLKLQMITLLELNV